MFWDRDSAGQIQLLIPATPRPELKFLARYFLAVALVIILCVISAF